MKLLSLPAWPLWCGIALLLTSVALELTVRRIPNVLTYSAALGGLVTAIVLSATARLAHGDRVGGSLAAAMAGLVVMYLPFHHGWLGGGYVKLIVGVGLWTGCAMAPWPATLTTLASAVAGTLVGGVASWVAKDAAPPGYFQAGAIAGLVTAAHLWLTQ